MIKDLGSRNEYGKPSYSILRPKEEAAERDRPTKAFRFLLLSMEINRRAAYRRFDRGWIRGEGYGLVSRRAQDVPAGWRGRCCRWLKRSLSGFSRVGKFVYYWACSDSLVASGWLSSCIAAGGLILCYLSTKSGFGRYSLSLSLSHIINWLFKRSIFQFLLRSGEEEVLDQECSGGVL